MRDEVPNLKDEREVFLNISSVAYSNANIRYEKGVVLLKGFDEETPFLNCYGSTVLFGNVLSKLNFKFNVVKTKGHVLILGDKYGFETTVEEGESMFYRQDLSKFYPIHQIGGTEMLLSSAYLSVGSYFMHNNEYSKAIDSYENTLKFNPKDSEILYNLGVAYSKNRPVC